MSGCLWRHHTQTAQGNSRGPDDTEICELVEEKDAGENEFLNRYSQRATMSRDFKMISIAYLSGYISVQSQLSTTNTFNQLY